MNGIGHVHYNRFTTNLSYRRFREMFYRSEPLPTSISKCNNLKRLGSGASGIVYAMDSNRVIKQYIEPSEIEYLAFTRIGSHPNIVKFLGSLDDGSILLERGKLLRHVLRETHDSIPLHLRLRWLRDAAEAISFIHQKGILHADIGCHNMILVGEQLKLIDFEGCSIDGQPATSAYEWFSYRDENLPISIQTEVFAYGCTVYEIITGKPPYHELVHDEDRDRCVQRLYQDDQFPDVSGLLCGELIERCWKGNFICMSEVLTELNRETSATLQVENQFWVKVQSTLTKLISRLHQFWVRRAWWYYSSIDI